MLALRVGIDIVVRVALATSLGGLARAIAAGRDAGEVAKGGGRVALITRDGAVSAIGNYSMRGWRSGKATQTHRNIKDQRDSLMPHLPMVQLLLTQSVLMEQVSPTEPPVHLPLTHEPAPHSGRVDV